MYCQVLQKYSNLLKKVRINNENDNDVEFIIRQKLKNKRQILPMK